MTTYKVVVPLVLARDQDGHTHHVYENGLIHWLSDDQAEHFLDQKLVEKVSGGSDSDGPPGKTALKEEWVAYAVSKGADEAEANALNKPDLIDLYG